MMKKKTYEKPTAQVVKLQHQCQILAGSVDANRQDYGIANDDVSGSEPLSEGNWLWN